MRNQYAIKIQRRLRGVLGRDFIRAYRREVARLRSLMAAAALRIQRCYRAWASARATRREGGRDARARMLAAYQAEVAARRASKARAARDAGLKAMYVRERAQEAAGRATGKVAFGAAGGRRLRAFQESPYGSNQVIFVVLLC